MTSSTQTTKLPKSDFSSATPVSMPGERSRTSNNPSLDDPALDYDAARQLGLEKYYKSIEAWRSSVNPTVDFERRAVDALYAMRDAVTALKRVQNMLLNLEVRDSVKKQGHDPDACFSYLSSLMGAVDGNRRSYKKTFFGEDN